MISKPQVRLLTALRDGYEGDEGQMAKITKDALTAAIATLESLPCTADGVFITPGMEVWISTCITNDPGEVGYVGENGAVRVNGQIAWPHPALGEELDEDGYYVWRRYDAGKLYSTRAAAEAARKEVGDE